MDLDLATDAWIDAGGQLADDRAIGEEIPRTTRLAVALEYLRTGR